MNAGMTTHPIIRNTSPDGCAIRRHRLLPKNPPKGSMSLQDQLFLCPAGSIRIGGAHRILLHGKNPSGRHGLRTGWRVGRQR